VDIAIRSMGCVLRGEEYKERIEKGVEVLYKACTTAFVK
jgi:hypothetical protein